MKPVAWKLWASVAVAGLALAVNACSGTDNLGNAGGDKTCQSTPCGNGSSIQVCTSTDAAGACSGVDYAVGGQTFHCSSCTDCTQAAEDAANACLSGGDGGTGSSSGSSSGSGSGSGGGSGSGSGGGSGSGSSSGSSGGGTTCSTASPCGTTASYEECTTTDATGACVQIVYKTSDGRTFPCNGCASCGNAAQELASYCATDGTPQKTCASPVSCGSTGITYEQCTTTLDGACEAIDYETSDGHTYTCNSCSDCSYAAQSLSSYCASLQPVTSCGSATTCGSEGTTYHRCETTAGGVCQAVYYQTSTGYTYQCNSCSDCSSALSSVDSYCASMNTPVTSCGSATACGSTGVTEQYCETTLNGVCQSVYYKTSTGYTYQCASCSDCSSASASLQSYCSSLGSGTTCGTTTCTSAQTCCSCSGTLECLTVAPGYTCADYGCQ